MGANTSTAQEAEESRANSVARVSSSAKTRTRSSTRSSTAKVDSGSPSMQLQVLGKTLDGRAFTLVGTDMTQLYLNAQSALGYAQPTSAPSEFRVILYDTDANALPQSGAIRADLLGNSITIVPRIFDRKFDTQ